MPTPINPVYTGAVQANSTFVVDRNYTVNELFGAPFIPAGATTEQVTVPDNVTLIFKGGKITWIDDCKIIGNNTRIVAPIEQIFDENIIPSGSWAIDRAYPQWFGFTPLTGLTDYRNTSAQDAGIAINKAIKMKKSGEVFLPKGFYPIQSPIIMYVGIKLMGEFGMAGEQDEYLHSGTVLQSWKNDQTTPLTDSSNRYMLYFNSLPDLDPDQNHATYGKPYIRLKGPNDGSGFKAGQVSEIRNITFYNHVPEQANTQTTSACLKAVYAADCLSLENVRFDQFRQAVVFRDDMYIDSRRIVNCAVYTGGQNLEGLSKDIYAFDLGFLGDNLLFEHNSIDGYNNKGIRISTCNGGKISSNIINADCQFMHCKALTFCNNHVEEGKQIEVICSNMTFSGNFYEKRFKPNIRIRGNYWYHKSVVTLINESFLFCENSRLVNTQEYNDILENIVVPGGQYPSEFTSLDNYKEFLALKSVSEDICEYDIDIDRDSEINLSNVFRYRITDSSVGDMIFTGISVRKVTYQYDDVTAEVTSESCEDFVGFNDFSYMLSKSGKISSGFHVAKHFVVDGITESISIVAQDNSSTKWMAESGYYEYRFQMLFDKQRPLVGTYNGSQLLYNNYIDGQDGRVIMGDNGCVLLAINAESELNGNHKMLRLYRYISNENNLVISKHYVDIPLSGTRVLYDNGLSINGFKWKTLSGTASSHSLKGDLGLQSILFEGKYVRCRTTSAEANLNSRTQWIVGDELLNVGADTGWTIKVIK